jgi:hypothetical protein
MTNANTERRIVEFNARMAKVAFSYVKVDIVRALPFVTSKVILTMLKAVCFDAARQLGDDTVVTPEALDGLETLVIAEFRACHPAYDLGVDWK